MHSAAWPDPAHLVVGALVALLVGAAGVAAGLHQPSVGAGAVTGPAPGSAPLTVSSGLAGAGAPSAGSAAAGTAQTGAAAPADGAGALTQGAAAPPDAPRAAAQWVERTATATGIPARALSAYADATLVVAAQDPACGLGWTTLAAIGDVESGHGTHGGTTLGADGRPVQPVLGPALDGRAGTAAIAATAASTTWTGDPVWDHAVGPLQFLTSTWQRWGVDGDGDGVADPNDLDDAALAAGHYLCAAGVDLASADGWWAAVRAYNHDDTYVQHVLTRANAYARAAAG